MLIAFGSSSSSSSSSAAGAGGGGGVSWSARGDGDGLMGGGGDHATSSSASVSWSVVAAAMSGWRYDDRHADGKEKRENERRLCSTADAEEALRVTPEERWRRGRAQEVDSTAIATTTAFMATNHHHAVVILGTGRSLRAPAR